MLRIALIGVGLSATPALAHHESTGTGSGIWHYVLDPAHAVPTLVAVALGVAVWRIVIRGRAARRAD